MTIFEMKQSKAVFSNAGRNAFLIGVPRENNPYKDPRARSAWDRSYMFTKLNYDSNFTAEFNLAYFLGYPEPNRDTFRRNVRRPETTSTFKVAAPVKAKVAATQQRRPNASVQNQFNKYRNTSRGGSFRVENAR